MTNYRAILQYHYRGNTTTQIAKLCECSRTTVLKTIKRAKECGIDEPAFELLSDIQLLEKLYIGPEIDSKKSGYYYHYYLLGRVGGHSFYGYPSGGKY